jgi:hypothetical protein
MSEHDETTLQYALMAAAVRLQKLITEDMAAVLCDPEGKVCIDGSDGDRRVLQEAIDSAVSATSSPLVDLDLSSLEALVVSRAAGDVDETGDYVPSAEEEEVFGVARKQRLRVTHTRLDVIRETARKLIDQGGPSGEARLAGVLGERSLFACRYRDEEGRSCALGFWIPDELYRESFETNGAATVIEAGALPVVVDEDPDANEAFWGDLQLTMHDDPAADHYHDQNRREVRAPSGIETSLQDIPWEARVRAAAEELLERYYPGMGKKL